MYIKKVQTASGVTLLSLKVRYLVGNFVETLEKHEV